MTRTLSVVFLLSLQWLVPASADTNCTVIDLMPAFWQALAAKDPAAQMRTAVIDPHPDLYNDKFVRLPTAEKWEDELAHEKTYVEAHRAEVTAAEQYLAANVPRYMQAFRQTFPDYRCDFTFYIAPGFGHMDGAATTVNGQHRIIFAPDVIPRLHPLNDLKVLINHETFHIYHHQASGVFGVDEEAIPTIEVALWSEGLATLASWRMNPTASLDVALLQPGIPEGARARLPAIATELLTHLEERDESTYARYFEGSKPPEGYPPRAGYYVGVLIAQSLSKRYTLRQLAHLKGPVLHGAIVSELQRLQGSTGAATGNVQAQAPATVAHDHLTEVACVDTPPGEKRPQFGCFNIGTVTGLHFSQTSVYWHLLAFPTRKAAETAKSATGIVVEEDGRVWLSEFGPRNATPRGGEAIAVVGPLQLPEAKSYSAVLSYAVMRPGDSSRVHTHPGPEAWYVLAGAQCLETPAGADRAGAGGTMKVRPKIPMELNVTGTALRRAFALVIHDSAQARGIPSDWKPSGACRG